VLLHAELEVENWLKDNDKSASKRALKDWRTKIKSSVKEAAAWIRGRRASVEQPSLVEVAKKLTSLRDQVEGIRRHWSKTWSGKTREAAEKANKLMGKEFEQVRATDWKDPTTEEVWKQMKILAEQVQWTAGRGPRIPNYQRRQRLCSSR
jgi:ElaB/YqjD/DUF883 family membrane-anchored ribosome-binding protein